MPLAPLKQPQMAAESGGAIHRDFFRWLMRLLKQANDNVIPIGCVMPAYLTSDDVSTYFDGTGLGKTSQRWAGWAICNGANDTPDLSDKFPRFATDAAGATGGSDTNLHTHDIDHNHGSFTSGSESSHTHGLSDQGGAQIRAFGSTLYWGEITEAGVTYNYTDNGTFTGGSGTGTQKGAALFGNTDAGSSHSHSVDVPALGTTASGSPSDTDNMPAYYELVPVMRVA